MNSVNRKWLVVRLERDDFGTTHHPREEIVEKDDQCVNAPT